MKRSRDTYESRTSGALCTPSMETEEQRRPKKRLRYTPLQVRALQLSDVTVSEIVGFYGMSALVLREVSPSFNFHINSMICNNDSNLKFNRLKYGLEYIMSTIHPDYEMPDYVLKKYFQNNINNIVSLYYGTNKFIKHIYKAPVLRYTINGKCIININSKTRNIEELLALGTIKLKHIDEHIMKHIFGFKYTRYANGQNKIRFILWKLLMQSIILGNNNNTNYLINQVDNDRDAQHVSNLLIIKYHRRYNWPHIDMKSLLFAIKQDRISLPFELNINHMKILLPSYNKFSLKTCLYQFVQRL
jgi:hypothetical protein